MRIGADLGDEFDDVERLKPVAGGGIGEVFRLRRVGRTMVLRVLPPEFTNDSARQNGVAAASAILARLNHPNISAIHDCGESQGRTFQLAEFIDGETVAERLSRRVPSFDETVLIANQVLEALEAAHREAIIHGALTPANIKLTPQGTVKVLDFGLMLATYSLEDDIPRGVVRTNIRIGHAPYISPELVQGERAEKPSDAWAFGCILYELLTGKQAFAGKDVPSTLTAVLQDEPDWTALSPRVPPAVVQLLRRLLNKYSDARGTIRDAVAVLQTLRP